MAGRFLSVTAMIMLHTATYSAWAQPVDPNLPANISAEGNYTAVIESISYFLQVTKFSNMSRRNTTNFWAPRMVRLAWHSAATYDPTTGLGGTNGAHMRFYPQLGYKDNLGLNVSQAQLEGFKQEFPWITYADLWTLAGCVAVKNMGGILPFDTVWKKFCVSMAIASGCPFHLSNTSGVRFKTTGPRIWWRPGRTDAVNGSNSPPDGLLPKAELDADHIRTVFSRLKLTEQETVALIGGGHALGGCHPELSGYTGQWSLTPQTFDNSFFKNLINIDWKPKNWTGNFQFENVIDMPQGRRNIFMMMLPTDMALKTDPAFFQWVNLFADNQPLFFQVFASAFQKVLELGVQFPPDSVPILV